MFTVLLRKASGAGYYAMAGLPYRPVLQLATPITRLAVMEGRTLAIGAFRTKLDDNFNVVAGDEEEAEKMRQGMQASRGANRADMDPVLPPRSATSTRSSSSRPSCGPTWRRSRGEHGLSGHRLPAGQEPTDLERCTTWMRCRSGRRERSEPMRGGDSWLHSVEGSGRTLVCSSCPESGCGADPPHGPGARRSGRGARSDG